MLVDQGLSSLSNFILGVFVARSVPATDYGVFAVGYSVYLLVVGASRGLVTEPLLVRFAGCDVASQRLQSRRALAAAAAIGVAAGGILVLGGLAARGELGTVLVVFGVCMPFLLVEDAYRFVLLVGSRAHLSALVDFVWLLVFGVLLATPELRAATASAPFVLAWAASATVAAAGAAFLARTLPQPSAAFDWIRTHLPLGARFALEFVLLTGGTQAVLYVVAFAGGYLQAGAYRGALVVIAPAWVAAAGMTAAAIPEGVRLRALSLGRLRRTVYGVGAGLAATALAWGLVASMLPDGAGRALLGDTWPATQPVLLPMAVYAAGFVAMAGLVTGLRALADARRSLALTWPVALLMLAGGSAGALAGGARGAALGMTVSVWLGVAAAAFQFERSLAAQASGDLEHPVERDSSPASGGGVDGDLVDDLSVDE